MKVDNWYWVAGNGYCGSDITDYKQQIAFFRGALCYIELAKASLVCGLLP
jgi:hypothetical protein